MLGTLISNIIAVVCFVITLFGFTTKKIKKNNLIVLFVMMIFAIGAILTWWEIFAIAQRHSIV